MGVNTKIPKAGWSGRLDNKNKIYRVINKDKSGKYPDFRSLNDFYEHISFLFVIYVIMLKNYHFSEPFLEVILKKSNKFCTEKSRTFPQLFKNHIMCCQENSKIFEIVKAFGMT